MDKSISTYYKQKSNLEVNDEYLESVSQKDIDLMIKAFAYVIIAPFAGITFMYLAKLAKSDISISKNFVY